MMRPSLSKAVRAAGRGLQSSRIARINTPNVGVLSLGARPSSSIPNVGAAPKFISTTPDRKGITPDNKAPKAKDDVTPEVIKTAADLTDTGYHLVADEYLDRLVTHLEDLQDQREDIDVEYSVRDTLPTKTLASCICV